MKFPQDARIAEGFLTNERLALIFGRGLVVGMVVCLAMGLQDVAEQIFKSWEGSYLPWMAALVGLEAVFTTGQARRARELELSVTVYRLVEWVVILALLKAFFYTRDGWYRLWEELMNIGPGLLDRVFDPEFILTALALLLLWLLATWTMNDLFEIESALVLLDSAGYERYYSDTAVVRNSIAQRLFGVGLLLVVVSGLAHADRVAILAGQFNVPQFQSWYVLAYFVLMILLLAQTYFSMLRAGWAWERIQIDPRIARQWLGYGLVALLVIGFAASLLPTRYSLGFLETLRWVINFLVGIVISVMLFIAMIFSYFLSWLLALLGYEAAPIEMPEVEPEPPLEPVEEILQTAAGPELVQSIFFWAFLTLVIIYAFYHYLRQNKSLFGLLKQFRLWESLEKLLGWVRGWVQGARQQVGGVLKSGLERLRSARPDPSRGRAFQFVNPNRMNPRQRVLFFYLALVQRGEQAGIPRRTDETPSEYEQRLKEYIQASEQPADPASLAELTRAFQEARYSAHAISPLQAKQVHNAWERLRQFFRGKR